MHRLARHGTQRERCQPAARTLVHQEVVGHLGEDGQIHYEMFRSVSVVDPAVRKPTSEVSTAAFAEASACLTDGGIRAKICTWVDYAYYTSGGYKYVSISSVKNAATRIDRYTSLQKLSWTAYQTAACGIGSSGAPRHVKSGYKTYPVSGASYSMGSGWYGQYQRLSSNAFDIAGSKETLNYNWRGLALSLYQDVRLH